MQESNMSRMIKLQGTIHICKSLWTVAILLECYYMYHFLTISQISKPPLWFKHKWGFLCWTLRCSYQTGQHYEVIISDRSTLWSAHIRQVNTMKCSYQTGQHYEVLISDRSALWGAHIRQVNTMKCSYQTGQHYEVLISDRSALGSETGMRTQNGIMCGAYSFSGTTVLEWSVV